jgi:3-methyladenine DNA glycosylase/8-oxoguanine DNA glycosylase
MPTPEQLESAAEAWRPYRSAASWYLWQALELEKFKKIKIQK